MRNAYLKTLYKLAKEDKNVLSLISDNGLIVYDDFKNDFPEQLLNFGMSENNMVMAGCGLASCGKIPFIYTISAFLAFRSFEFIRVDACVNNLNVKIVGIGSGVSYGYLGPTHHSTEDIGVLRVLPNLTIFSPSTPLMAQKVTEQAYKIKGPVYIRLGTNNEKEFYSENYNDNIKKLNNIIDGKDFYIISTGSIAYDAFKACQKLNENGYNIGFIDANCLKPFDSEALINLSKNCKNFIIIEEHNIISGLSSIVSDVIAENGLNCKVYKIGLNDVFAKGYGNHNQVKKQNGLDYDNIYLKIKNILENK